MPWNPSLAIEDRSKACNLLERSIQAISSRSQFSGAISNRWPSKKIEAFAAARLLDTDPASPRFPKDSFDVFVEKIGKTIAVGETALPRQVPRRGYMRSRPVTPLKRRQESKNYEPESRGDLLQQKDEQPKLYPFQHRNAFGGKSPPEQPRAYTVEQ